jgi:hypothetical protein
MHFSKVISFCLLAAILFGCAVTNADQASVSLHVFGSSSKWWVAVQPQNDNGATSQVELKDDAASDFVSMEHSANWGYYSASALGNDGFNLPLTIRLSSADGAQITTRLEAITPDAIVDTGATFSGSGNTAGHHESESEPAESESESESEFESESEPAEPESEPAESESEAAESESEPAEPQSESESEFQPAPAESEDSSVPAAPSAPAPASSNTDLCAITSTSEEPLKILVPLYVYPGAAWDSLVDAASQVKIIAIINPNSGPLPTVDSTYATYFTKLHDAGIEIVGYVHTSYGARSISDVQADINTYAASYPLVTGIFFDEAANDASELSYYTQAYNFAMSKPGYDQVILNPGVQPDQGYLSISTSIVIFENYASSLAGTSFDSWVTCAPSAAEKAGYKYRFTGIAHTAAAGTQSSVLSSLANRGMGLVYVTDGEGGCCTYNELVSYFSAEATAVQALN